ncbi:hypothetical protein BDV23DRAFT_152688 [Aspergillus alliaceus]|uniref:Uncharacterized protein n=1 Tax=Petromyces alliaceus TaxID=209559 RepID=A0A5N7CE21_PETAA|nr:hypothetical protein BDV23DRAFT_152688 [Aspergillus alliaceus]
MPATSLSSLLLRPFKGQSEKEGTSQDDDSSSVISNATTIVSPKSQNKMQQTMSETHRAEILDYRSTRYTPIGMLRRA